MSKRIFIVGGGRFGTHLAMRLCEFGAEVVIADANSKRVEDLAEDGFHAIQMDADDEGAYQAAGIKEADAVVVAIGENMQASVLATLLLKQLPVKRLIARAVDDKHAQVLEKLGADLVVLPNRDTAYRLAERLRGGTFSDRLPIGGDFQLARIRIGHRLDSQTLSDARLPSEYGITAVLIRRGAEAESDEEENVQNFEPKPDFVLQLGDVLTLAGKRARIDEFERRFGATHTP
jgi:trk system potassium uptake protein TrkA